MTHLSRFDLEYMAKKAASEHLSSGRDLDDCIASLAGSENVSREQIKRVVESSNTFVNAELVKRAKSTGQDPRVAPEKLASSDGVFARLMGERPAAKEAHAKAVDKIANAFVVTGKKASKVSVDEAMGFGDGTTKIADIRPAQKYASSLGLAQAYVAGVEGDASAYSSRTLDDACGDLELLHSKANVKCAEIVNQADDMSGVLADTVRQQMLSGTTPATLRDLVKRAKIGDKTATMADIMITKCAEEVGASEGTTQIVADTLISRDHAFFVGLTEIDKLWKEAEARDGLRDKIASAEGRARADWARSVRASA